MKVSGKTSLWCDRIEVYPDLTDWFENYFSGADKTFKNELDEKNNSFFNGGGGDHAFLLLRPSFLPLFG